MIVDHEFGWLRDATSGRCWLKIKYVGRWHLQWFYASLLLNLSISCFCSCSTFDKESYCLVSLSNSAIFSLIWLWIAPCARTRVSDSLSTRFLWPIAYVKHRRTRPVIIITTIKKKHSWGTPSTFLFQSFWTAYQGPPQANAPGMGCGYFVTNKTAIILAFCQVAYRCVELLDLLHECCALSI